MPLYGQQGYGSGKYGIQDNSPIYKQPISYYLNLITSLYYTKPKFMAFVQKLLQPLDDLSNCLAFLSNNYDIDFAVGVQLDVLGIIIGQSRRVGFQPSNNVSPVLDDNTYRLLLQAKIQQNKWDGKLVSLPNVYAGLFSSGRLAVLDQQNMTCDIVIQGINSSIIQDLILNGYILPRPEGVLYNYSFGIFPVLGADENNEFIAGADLGHAI